MRVSKPPNERKAELIAAARILFDKKGVDKTRVSDIVSFVGVAQGAFYYYFPSKEAVVQEVVQQISAEVEKYSKELLVNNNYSFSQKLAAFLNLYVSVADQFWADDEQYTPEDSKSNSLAFPPGVELLYAQMLKLITQGIAQGEIKLTYPAQSVLVLLNGLRAYVYCSKPNKKMIFTITEEMFGLTPESVLKYSDSKNPVQPLYG